MPQVISLFEIRKVEKVEKAMYLAVARMMAVR